MTTSNAAPVSAPEGHDAAMAAAFDAAQGTPPSSEQPVIVPPEGEKAAIPEWVPAKFRDAADPMKAMADAYAELEDKQSTPDATVVPETPEAALAVVEAAGLDFAALSTEYAAEGGLTAATYAKLAAAGIPQETVDAYITGQEAIAQQGIDNVLAEVGGPEAYGQMVNWAAANLPKNEVTAFNNAMDNGNVDSIKLTIAGLQARYLAANGTEPKLLNGEGGNTEVDGYRSTAELTAAMSDPRYAKDAAYRADVQAKAGRSNVF